MQLGVIICNVVLIAISFLIFLMSWNKFKDKTSKNNSMTCVVLGLFMAMGSFFVPEFIMPMQAIALILQFYSDFACAAAYLAFLSIVSMAAAYENGVYFLFCFLTGLILLVCFREPDIDDFHVGRPTIVFALCSVTVYTSLVVLNNISITPETVIFPIVGIVINSLIVLIALPKIAHGYLFALEEKWQKLCDPEYELLMELKKKNPLEFRYAIHSAYLTDRVAERIGADRRMAKSCAYYKHIGLLKSGDEPIKDKTASLIAEHEFPEPLQGLINQYTGFTAGHYTKESSITYICNEMIRSIIRFNNERPNEHINYDALINLIFERIMNKSIITDSDLSYRDIKIIRKKLKEERLYYDFLR